MTKRLLIVAALILVAYQLGCPPTARAQQPIPQPLANHLVQDLGHGLLGNDATALDTKLLAYEKESGNEISVASIFDLKGDSIDEYAPRLFKQWGIGKKGKDNGILILWAIKDRKVRIEVGYGLEDRITDGKAGRILRDQILSNFKNADFYKGLDQGTSALITELKIPPTTATDLNTAIPPTTSTDLLWLWILLGLGLAGVTILFIYHVTKKEAPARTFDQHVYLDQYLQNQTAYSQAAAISTLTNYPNRGYNRGIVDNASFIPVPTYASPSYTPSPSPSYDPSPSFDFGGGSSGGAGASGSY